MKSQRVAKILVAVYFHFPPELQPIMDVLDTVVKVLEALEHLTIIIGAFGALWTVFKMTEENRARMKVTIRNDFGYTLRVRCPQAVDNPTWQVLSVS